MSNQHENSSKTKARQPPHESQPGTCTRGATYVISMICVAICIWDTMTLLSAQDGSIDFGCTI